MEEQRPKKKNLFEREANILKESRSFLDNEEATNEELRQELARLGDNFEELLDQSKLITKVSDRLNKKINRTNEALETKNIELQETLDALTQARLGRKAATITLLIFLVLFLVGEGVIEPYLEDYVHYLAVDNFGEGNHDYLEVPAGLALKAVLALMFRPIEKVVERILLNKAQKKKEQELAKKLATQEANDWLKSRVRQKRGMPEEKKAES